MILQKQGGAKKKKKKEDNSSCLPHADNRLTGGGACENVSAKWRQWQQFQVYQSCVLLELPSHMVD